MVLPFVLLCSEATKPQSQLEQATMNITHCIYLKGWFTITFGMLIKNAVMLLAFLAIPKNKYFCLRTPRIKKHLSFIYLADKEHEGSAKFQKFWCNLFHGSINQILKPLWQYMETPDIICYGDGYY